MRNTTFIIPRCLKSGAWALWLCFGVMGLWAAPPIIASEIVVIVHPSNQSQLDLSLLKRLYLGKIIHFPNGKRVETFGLKQEALRSRFYQELLDRTESGMNAYWARMLFTGRAKPPRIVESELEMRRRVAMTPNALGYIQRENVDATVKVIELDINQ